MGVNPTAWGFSVYQEIIDKLVKAGIHVRTSRPSAMQTPTPKSRYSLRKSAPARSGYCWAARKKMGTGTNVQKRLVALHHLDAPWKPAEVEQRDGRILRKAIRMQKWRSTATSRKAPLMRTCGRL